MFKKPNELNFSNKKFVTLITGRPGVGKTTLSLSAPKPVLFDLEQGIVRVEACYRGVSSQIEEDIPPYEKYNSLLKDIRSPEMAQFETVIIDSLGKLIEDYLTPYVIHENPVNGQRDGKTLSIKGYGAIKSALKELQKELKSLNKNLIYIAHVTEDKKDDITTTRLLVPGKTKDDIWDDIDIGGYIELVGNKRRIFFAPTERFDAKKTQGVDNFYDIPILKSTKEGGKFSDNNFLARLFNTMRENLTIEQETSKVELEKYNKAMTLTEEIEKASNVEDLRAISEKIKNAEHSLTSKEELTSKFKAKMNELNIVYDAKAKDYVAKQ